MLYHIICKTKKNLVHLINLRLCNKTPKEPSKAFALCSTPGKAENYQHNSTKSGSWQHFTTVNCLTDHSPCSQRPSPSQDTHMDTLRPVQQLFKCTFNYNHTESPDLINTDELG